MEDRQLYVRLWQDEAPRFRRVLEALPEGHLDFRPHERSRSARELAWTLVDVVSLLVSSYARARLAGRNQHRRTRYGKF
jgi:hypothetical protein